LGKGVQAVLKQAVQAAYQFAAAEAAYWEGKAAEAGYSGPPAKAAFANRDWFYQGANRAADLYERRYGEALGN
jgi:hypothetical protein